MSIPKSLHDRLRERKIIPFVGAGVSMNVLDRVSHQPVFPNWRQLLTAAADRLESENKGPDAVLVRSLLNVNPPDFVEAATRARKALGGLWYEVLKDAIDVDFDRIEGRSLELARSIWRLGSQLVITTNYDNVLKWACPYDHLQSWDIQSPVEQAFLLRGEMKRLVIWHLHGHVENASRLILSRDGYQLLYPDSNHSERKAHYAAALTTLRHQFAARSLLFVGFSLDDEHLGLQLKGVHELYDGAGTHYAIVREGEAERIRHLNMGIEPITFSSFGEPQLTLMKQLGDVVEPQQLASVSPATLGEKPIVIPDYGPHQPVFYVPFKQKGDEIVGQQKVLEDVRKQLTEGKRTAIGQTAAFRGLGGLGKTQLAIEYAYRYRDEYPNGVIWINADQDIDAQLIEIAEKGRWIAPESDHKYKIQIAQQRIRSHSDCLIIFDNLDDRAAIDAYLPEPEANPHILVTSRIDHVDFYPVPVALLDEALSGELLLKEARREPENEDEEKAAKGIVILLGGLPLALELAGAYLSHRRGVTFQQYYELLNNDLKNALPKNVSSFTKHEADLYSTLRLSEGLLQEEAHLHQVLDLLTWSGSAPMSIDLISHLLDIPNSAALAGALSLGAELRLLQRSKESDSYSIHRLVGEVRRTEIALEQRLEWVDQICSRLGDWFQEKKEDFSQLTTFESEIDHLKRWQQNAMQFAPSHASRLMWLQAYPAYHRGRFVESRNYVIEAQKIFDEFSNSNQELRAHLLTDLADTNSAAGCFVAVREMYEKPWKSGVPCSVNER
ncbi:MAG TPA: SIR2 family protein [Pyrinomonadaceae bacterium]|nr:SIR2 family protein [Pyrinomonadaceae bacterium]